MVSYSSAGNKISLNDNILAFFFFFFYLINFGCCAKILGGEKTPIFLFEYYCWPALSYQQNADIYSIRHIPV